MNIKKGVSFVAFGFLFTLVNFNLNFPSFSINIMPEFVGWLLFFLAYDKLGSYISDRQYMKWGAMTLLIINAAFWIMPSVGLGAIRTILSICQDIYWFIILGVMEQVAEDYGSSQQGSIRFIKYFNIIVGAGFIITSLAGEELLSLAAFIGIAAIIAAIVTIVILFKLRKEIPEEI